MEYEDNNYGRKTYLTVEKKVEHAWMGKLYLMGVYNNV